MKRAFTLIEGLIALVMLVIVLAVGSALVLSFAYGPDAYTKLTERNIGGTSLPESAWNELKKAIVARLPSDMGASFKELTVENIKKVESPQNGDRWVIQNGEIELQSLLDPTAPSERRTYSCIVQRKDDTISVDHLKIDDPNPKPQEQKEPPKPATKK